MNEYTIVRKTDWDKVPVLKMENCLFPSESGVTAQAQICYDEKALYVKLQTVEAQIRAELTGLLDEICEDSCLEFFFCPMEGDDRYFNLEVNPNGAMYFGFGTSVQNLYRLIPENHPIHPVIERTEDGWQVEYAFPVEFVQLFFPGFAPAPGKTIRANCFKCGNFTPIPHWLCWNDIPAERATFHCPEYFGIMTFA